MLQSIRLQGFKGFKDTTVRPLRKVNLIVGGQNVGKTSLLEAVSATLGNGPGELAVFRPNEESIQRQLMNTSFDEKGFRCIEIQFNNLEQVRVINRPLYSQLAHLYFNGGWWVVDGTCKKEQVPTFVSLPLYLPLQLSLVQLFGQLVLARKKRELTQMLRQIEPRLEALDAIAPDGEQRIYAELTGIDQALPLPTLGHGFARLLYLFSTLLSTDAKLALIDEVENGIHYSALLTLLQGIKNVARDRDVQTIMTTHSMDCIKAASKVFEDSPDDFQVIRLVRTADNIEADIIPADAVQAVLEHNGEVR